jgi:thiol-disulfide isomerase/thioredoxin
MTISLIDARADSLTVTWPAASGATTRYVLEYKTSSDDNFQELSSKLTQTQAKKKNLTPDTSYYFRVAAVTGVNGSTEQNEWITHNEAFRTLATTEEAKSMPAPTTATGGSNALVVYWTKVNGAKGYELQMRENEGGHEWTTIAASLTGTEVKKKNLTSSKGYQFRVQPIMTDMDDARPFSPPSDPAVAKGLSPAMKRWFETLDDSTLLRSGVSKPVPLEDALGGKEFVLLYASAHWCPPCRKFTPMLANWYKTVQSNVEIVFLSADHDESGFQSYFGTHPWMAVDFEDDTREQLMAAIKVSGIPRLVVIHAETGQIVEDNAVGKPFDMNRWRAAVKR